MTADADHRPSDVPQVVLPVEVDLRAIDDPLDAELVLLRTITWEQWAVLEVAEGTPDD